MYVFAYTPACFNNLIPNKKQWKNEQISLGGCFCNTSFHICFAYYFPGESDDDHEELYSAADSARNASSTYLDFLSMHFCRH